MEKKIVKKTIKKATILLFVILFLQAISPIQTATAAGLNWENPNKSGSNPYQFKIKDTLNSELIMQVVGCTGVVDKVSSAVTNFAKDKVNKIIAKQKQNAAIKACEAGKKILVGTAAIALNTQLATAGVDAIKCEPIQKTTDKDVLNEAQKSAREATATKKRDECLNGIAVTLAKNQLTAMTRYTLSWVNSGFNGDPMYIRNMDSFVNSIEKNLLQKEIDLFKDPNNSNMYPFGRDYARMGIDSYTYNSNIDNALKQDLTNYINTGDDSALNTKQATTRAISNYATDFSAGGWDGWLGLTQHDQNNPLGFTMVATNNLAQKQQTEIENTKAELLRNGGILDQKKCVAYGTKPSTSSFTGEDGQTITENIEIEDKTRCEKYEAVTPGSMIKDKVSAYLNSDVRQLELTRTINDSLNAVFSALLSKFQQQGLSGLSTDSFAYGDPNMGTGRGVNNFTADEVDANGNIVRNSGYTDSFDLTRDLGNTYLHNNRTSIGTWDAKNNIPKLYAGLGNTDTFYTVSVAGSSKIINDGYNGWSVGDRAYFNGREWQNWKAGVANPIDKRGVIQIQKDYIVAAKETLTILPNIMPKIGELDYCIPGPNLSWQANTGDAYSMFSEYAYSLGSEYKAKSFLKRDADIFQIAQPGDLEYDNYKNIFTNTSTTMWQAITNTPEWQELDRLGGLGEIKKNSSQSRAKSQIESIQALIQSNLEQFRTAYESMVVKLFGSRSLMKTATITKESSTELIPNPSFLPMAETGSNITKDITTYNTDISAASQNYKDDIIEANSNIYKLDKIKDQVSKIIVAAQKRRDDNLVKILNDESISNGTPLLTAAQYKAKYSACLEEENITFYEDTDIITNTGGDIIERCNDGLDNDLNGFIDLQDPACKGLVGSNVGTGI